MLTKEQFDILTKLQKNTFCDIATFAEPIAECKRNGWITDDGKITPVGLDVLEPYKVRNAVIMAAGMSTRFAPLSYEKPKGLLVVKGEVLIERQIEQLLAAGISDITVVVGYMKEQFFYLEDKYGVSIVVNEDYYRYNNTSTLMRVLDKLNNTYICSSDNYFTENVFEQYVYQGYYSAVQSSEKTNEYCLTTDANGRITDVTVGGADAWYMLGHVYFSHDFCEKFIPLLQEQYNTNPAVKEMLWEDLYMCHLDTLSLYIRKYDDSIIKEFDSLAELREFDDHYINNTGSGIFKNICSVLQCEDKDIIDIVTIKKGLTNTSFQFTCNEQKYVYRHPGVGTDAYINRNSEAFSMQVAKELELDDTFIYMHPEQGWKLSRYIDEAHTLDYHDEREVRTAISMMKKLHDANVVSDYDFDIWQETRNFIDRIAEKGRNDFADFQKLYDTMEHVYQLTVLDEVPKRLCHCDCYDPNFLVGKDGKMYLIDWEYSGNDDPANDLGTFICCSDYTYEEALAVLKLYYGRELTIQELRHTVAYIAIASYYWYVWAIYQESVGNTVGEYLYIWYKDAKFYAVRALELYGEK